MHDEMSISWKKIRREIFREIAKIWFLITLQASINYFTIANENNIQKFPGILILCDSRQPK